MKKGLFFIAAIFMMAAVMQTATAQTTLQDEEYSYVTMDLRGILDLTMTTDPQVNFSFNTIQDYQTGLVKYSAVRLEVDATVSWDMFVYASSDTWTQVEAYSTNGAAELPAEILMISQKYDNSAAAGSVGVGPAFQSLRGMTNSGVNAGTGAPAATTQFLAGDLDLAVAMAPGTAAGNPSTNAFRVNYRLWPGVPATFNTHGEIEGANDPLDLASVGANAVDYAQAGYYYLEVVYSLVENL